MMAMPIRTEDWVRRARYISNYDGDTVVLEIDVGFGWKFGKPNSLRVMGVNCPELREAGGKEAGQFTREWLSNAVLVAAIEWPLIVQSFKADRKDKYGRYLVTIWRTIDERSLADDLIAAGHAVAYNWTGPRA